MIFKDTLQLSGSSSGADAVSVIIRSRVSLDGDGREDLDDKMMTS